MCGARRDGQTLGVQVEAVIISKDYEPNAECIFIAIVLVISTLKLVWPMKVFVLFSVV